MVARGAAARAAVLWVRADAAVADDGRCRCCLTGARAEAPGVSASTSPRCARGGSSRVRPAARAAALEPQHAGPVARSALGGLFAALRLPGAARRRAARSRRWTRDAALEHGDVVGALAALRGGRGRPRALGDWRRDAAASCVAAQTTARRRRGRGSWRRARGE